MYAEGHAEMEKRWYTEHYKRHLLLVDMSFKREMLVVKIQKHKSSLCG